MTDYMTGDAFKEDRVDEKMYGHSITEDNCSISFVGDEEMPEPMCNTVCYFKSEEQNPHSRNLLAVSKSYICYTVKKSKLRVIHSESGHMALLVGHELPVIDLKFSKADSSVLCSVDNAISTDNSTNATAHIFIWRLTHAGDVVTSTVLAQFAFGASIVEPHPHDTSVFAVAKGNNVGIITTSLGSKGSLQLYEELSLNASVDRDIVDLSFSTDGKMLLVITATDIIAYMLPAAELLIQGEGTLTRINKMINAPVRKSNISSITCLPCGFLTASRGTAISASTCVIELTLHAADIGDTFLDVIQSMQITLPKHTSEGRVNETSNDIKLAFKSTGDESINLIILCHRLSSILVCFAVDPSRVKSKRKQLPICHGTFFDLKSPVFTLDTTTIKGRNYYSDDEVEHLEVACYQVQGAKTAVYQYHFNCCSLYSADGESAKETADRFVESLRDTDRVSSRSLIEFTRESVTAPIPFIATSTVTVTHSKDLEPCVIMKPVESAPEEFSWSETEASSEETSCVSLESIPDIQPPLPEILRSSGVKGKSIMSMLSKLKVTSTPVSSIPEPTTVPITQTSGIATSTSISNLIIPTRTIPSQDPTLTAGSDNTPPESQGTVARFMLGVIGNLFPEPPVIDADPVEETIQIVSTVVLPEEEDGEDDWAEASAAVAVTSSSNSARPSPPAPALVGREALDHALASSKASRAVTPVPQALVLDIALHEKVNDLTRGVFALASSIIDLKSITSSSADRMAIADDAPQVAAAERQASEQRVEKAMQSMKAELMSEMRDLMVSAQSKNKLEEQASKIESANAASARDKVQLLAINKSMKALMEVEMKKAVEVIYYCLLHLMIFRMLYLSNYYRQLKDPFVNTR